MRIERSSAKGTSSASYSRFTRFTSFASFTRLARFTRYSSFASPAGFAQPIINYSIPPTFVFETSASRFTLVPSFT